MMLLGLVLHSAITYRAAIELNWGLQDANARHILNDCFVIYIHTFRMPIFFLVAGFFGAMLFHERGPLSMMRNRVSRILLPFLVFIVIVNALNIFAFSYSSYALGEDKASPLPPMNPLSLIPRRTGHLWFLYYLCYLTTIGLALALMAKKVPAFAAKYKGLFDWVFARPLLRLFTLATGTAIILLANGTTEIPTSTSVIPNIGTLMFYGFPYLLGWSLYSSKELLPSLQRFCWLFFALGSLLVFIKMVLYFRSGLNPFSLHPVLLAVNALSIWTLILGISGLFLLYCSKPSKRMRYISDASYWIYLIHLPITALIPGLIADWSAPGYLKSLIVLVLTSALCLLSYHFCVRSTFIGQFLNGRKYPRS